MSILQSKTVKKIREELNSKSINHLNGDNFTFLFKEGYDLIHGDEEIAELDDILSIDDEGNQYIQVKCKNK